MTRIAYISEAALNIARAASVADIQICQMAIAHGITHTSGGAVVKERLEGNQEIIRKIDAELLRRKVPV